MMARAGRAEYLAGKGMLRSMGVLKRRLAAAVRAAVDYARRAPGPRGGVMEHVTVSKRSVLSGKLNVMVICVDPNALERWLASPREERLFLRDEFPHLSADEREFLLSGSTPDEWNKYFGIDT